MASYDDTAYSRSLQHYHESLKTSSTQDDLLSILAKISCESRLITAHKEISFPKDIPYSDTHPLVFEDGGYFVIGFDEDALCFAITARTPDHYAVLSELQDKMVETELATNGVHVVGEADEVLFPSYQYYFDECKRLKILSHTLAFDLKNNLTLLERLDAHQRKERSDPTRIAVDDYTSFLMGIEDDCPYIRYTQGFAKKLVQDYALSLVETDCLATDLEAIISTTLSKSVLEIYADMKRLTAKNSTLLTLNDYDKITPKYVTTFNKLIEKAHLHPEKSALLQALIDKINMIQDAFESAQENHKPAHDILFKEVVKAQALVPLSVSGLMQCRSAQLNIDANALFPSLFPDMKVSLLPISDIEHFMRFFHEKGTVLRCLERDDETVTGTLDLMDVHLMLERHPLTKTNAAALGVSYRMLGHFQMGEKVGGLPIVMYGLPPVQYAALNLVYQLTGNACTLSQKERLTRLQKLETLLRLDVPPLLPISWIKEATATQDKPLSFDETAKQLMLSTPMMSKQKEQKNQALSSFLEKKRHHYFVLDQGGNPYGIIDWFFY